MPGIGLSKCVFITGGTSGVGRALGYKIKDLPNKPQVIMAGRRQERLDALSKDGFGAIRMDLGNDRTTLQKEAEHLLVNYPDLDTIILNAGIQREVHFREGTDLDEFEEEMRINFHSVFTLVAVFLPHFLKLGSQGRQTFLILVTSRLAILPGPQFPSYCASKAAAHSLTLALGAQLVGTGVNVLEIMPPLVESELHDAEGTTEAFSKFWMPLDEFIPITMDGLLSGNPTICPGNSQETWDKFEKGKDEIVARLWKNSGALMQ